MANRSFVLPSFQLEKQVVRLYARITFGSSGAPTLVANACKGIVSVTRNSAGVFTLVLGNNVKNSTAQASLDFYYRLLSVTCAFDATGNSGTAPAAPLFYLTGNSVATPSTCSLQVTFNDITQTAADPASGEAVDIEITLSNSGAT